MRPLDLLPPGYAKSYDPQVQFAPDGDVVVVAGASRAGPAGCHPGSVVFAAHVDRRAVSYRILAAAPPGEFYDRPMSLVTPDGPRVSFTASAGPGAPCRATPVRSRVVLLRLDWTLTARARLRVPAASKRVYGSSMATFGAGRLAVVSLATLPAGRTAVSVAVAPAAGQRLRLAAVIPAGPAVLASVPPLGGVVTAVPVAAGAIGRPLVVAWSRAVPGGRVRSVVAQSPDGRSFARMPDLPMRGVSQLTPTVVMAPTGAVFVVVADVRSGSRVDFPIWRATRGGWERLASAGRGSAGYQELGEELGVAVAAERLTVAVPVQGPNRSTLDVTSLLLPPVGASTRSPTPTAGDNPPRQRPDPASGSSRWWLAAVVVAVLVAWAARVVHVQRRRRRRRG